MNVPPWQPPGKPAPFAPAAPARAPSTPLAAVGPALLRAPLWAPQEGESTTEHCAFLAWLMGGYVVRTRNHDPEPSLGTRGDWAAALGVLGGNSAQVHALAIKWSWEVRGREYWTTTRAIGEAAATTTAETVLEYAALARELDRKWLELSILELDKAIVEAKRIMPEPGQETLPQFMPRLFNNRELIALRRADGALEIQRFRAGVLERAKGEHDDETITDWARLPPADLEAFRKLRDKARTG